MAEQSDHAADPARPFDRSLLALRRERSAASLGEADFLLQEGAQGLADRLAANTRRFPLALDLSAARGQAGHAVSGTGKVDRLISTDTVPQFARGLPVPSTVCDEEQLPFAEGALDLVVANLALSFVNDLPGTLLQIRHALKPDGLFLGCVFGGDTLAELRAVLLDAEASVSGGASPRVAPFLDIRDAGGLLQRAGLALPVVDAEKVTVRYATPFKLVADLRAMGWTNMLAARSRTPLRRDILLRAVELYAQRYSDDDDRVRATFEFVYLSGWAPHESQQQPMRPGSARMRLAEALGTREIPSGEKPR